VMECEAHAPQSFILVYALGHDSYMSPLPNSVLVVFDQL
jgi:hypothetical protein